MKHSDLPESSYSTEHSDGPELPAPQGLAAYNRPLLRSHGGVSSLTAKSGDVIPVITNVDSDVNLKENIVPVAWA